MRARVALIDLAERAELIEALAVGGFEQRPARVLDPAAGRGVRAVVGVLLVAADLVDGVGADAHHVKGIQAHLGVGNLLADGLLIPVRYVDQDRPDVLAALTELGEEPLQRGAVRPFGTHTKRPLSWSATTVR